VAIFVYCASKSTGARDLAAALGGTRLRNFDGLDFRVRGKKVEPKAGDLIICWGSKLPAEMEGVKILNGKGSGTKLHAALALAGQGIPTIKVSTFKESDSFVGRLNDHEGGNDLLHPPTNPDFWVRMDPIVKEYRVHSFCGKAIRSGVKVHRDGFPNPNPKIRSYDAGWKIKYDNFESTSKMRGLAHKAVKVLGLDFGAVDIGEFADGSLMVLEVNKAPGIEGGSIAAYTRSVQKWLEQGGMNMKTPSEKGTTQQAGR